MMINIDLIKSILESVILEFGDYDFDTGELKPSQSSVISDVVRLSDNLDVYPIVSGSESIKNWDGEGKPTVGTICEFRSKGCSLNHGKYSDWLRCEVIAVTRAYAILRHIGVAYTDDHECSHNLSHIEFRPIRTKAERDKERLERLIQNTLRECHYSTSDEDVSRKISGVILTDGWQKPENNL